MIPKAKMIVAALACHELSVRPTGSSLQIVSYVKECAYDHAQSVSLCVAFQLGREWRFFDPFLRTVDDFVTMEATCELYDQECRSMMLELTTADPSLLITLEQVMTNFSVSKSYRLNTSEAGTIPSVAFVLIGCGVAIVLIVCVAYSVYRRRRYASREHASEITLLVRDMREFLDSY